MSKSASCEICHENFDWMDGKVFAKRGDWEKGKVSLYLSCQSCAGDTKPDHQLFTSASIKTGYLFQLINLLEDGSARKLTHSSLQKYLKWGILVHGSLCGDLTEEDIDNRHFSIHDDKKSEAA